MTRLIELFVVDACDKKKNMVRNIILISSAFMVKNWVIYKTYIEKGEDLMELKKTRGGGSTISLIAANEHVLLVQEKKGSKEVRY